MAAFQQLSQAGQHACLVPKYPSTNHTASGCSRRRRAEKRYTALVSPLWRGSGGCAAGQWASLSSQRTGSAGSTAGRRTGIYFWHTGSAGNAPNWRLDIYFWCIRSARNTTDRWRASTYFWHAWNAGNAPNWQYPQCSRVSRSLHKHTCRSSRATTSQCACWPSCAAASQSTCRPSRARASQCTFSADGTTTDALATSTAGSAGTAPSSQAP